MMHLLTPEEHAQIVDALDNGLPEVRQAALAMLKAMKPVTPSLYSVTYGGAHVNNFHRVKENAEHEMRRLERNFPEPASKRKVKALYAKEQQ